MLSLPDAPADRWLNAATTRRSRRSFDGRPLDSVAFEAFAGFCDSLRPFPGVRTAVAREMPAEAFKGIVGSYGRVHGAPSGMLMVGPDDSPVTQAAVGYTGEACILEATALGLGTCWVGGMYRGSVARRAADVATAERVFAISPLGYPTQTVSSAERIVYRTKPGASKPRKPLEEIAPGVGTAWPGWARTGVEAARNAPSANNRQPWRFRLDGEAIVLSFDGPEGSIVSKRLDCGIAMLHFEVAVRSVGTGGSWELLEHRSDVARFTLGT